MAHWIDPEKVTAAREKKGITKAEFARKLETSPSHVSRLENPDGGTDSGVDFAYRVAQILDVKIEDLLSEYDPE